MISDDEKTWEIVDEEKEALLSIIKGATGPTRKKFNSIMRRIGCENYHCTLNLAGNQVRRFLRKEVIYELISIFPPTQRLEYVKNFLYDVSHLMSTSDSSLKTPKEVADIKAKAHPKRGVIFKLHLLTAHLVPYLETFSTWDIVTEQGMEMSHQVFKKDQLRLAPIRDPVQNGMALVQSYSNHNWTYDVGEEW